VVAIKKAVDVKYRYGYVVIDSSLFEGVMYNNLPFSLISKMEDILGYSVDFFHLNKGDVFKIIFTEKIANNQSLGVDRIEAIQYIGLTKKIEAFSYEKDETYIYIDQFGKDLKKAFLLSPLKYGRMTSAFNLQRLHPVTGELKGHFGTDYAAPEGTPILSVADGVIEKYDTKMETNGNYAKVRHDKTYESQYLHMSAFVDGMKVGTRVRQGQVIGFVGQTGLATGPHVCFRFWKNGVQINHLEENLPSGNQMLSATEKLTFDTRRDSLMTQLKNINGVN
jgi:murein DD-endopeptidase MepM/ murein hydrolase activator NlpD